MDTSDSSTSQAQDLAFKHEPQVVFCCLWTTGMEPGQDHLVRILALARRADCWESLDRLVVY